MNRLAQERWRAAGKVASVASIVTVTFGALVACADSTVLGTETPTPEAGAVLPALDGGEADGEAGAVLPDAGADVDAAIPLCSTDGFCHTVVPNGLKLVSVWGDGTGVVWALSSGGDILRWDGSAWNIHQQTGLEGTSIWGSGPTDVWVVSGGHVFHGSGATPASLVFTAVEGLPGDPMVPLRSIWGTGPNDIWAVGMYENWEDWPPMFMGRVLHFGGPPGSGDPDAGADDGSSGDTGWTSDDELASMGIGFRAVWGSPTTGVWMDGLVMDDFGSSIRLVRRPVGASDWTVMGLPWIHEYAIGIHGAAVTSDSSILVSGVTGVPEETYNTTWTGTSTDDGATFTWSYSNHAYWIREFLAYWGTGPDDAWGVGENGLVSHWDGSKWTQAVLRVTDVPVGRTFRAIWGKSNDDLWVVGDEVALHKTTAGKP